MYEKQTWLTGEVITKEKLNHMEDGIANSGGVDISVANGTGENSLLANNILSNVASGVNSHASGSNTIANHANQHVFGMNNIADDSENPANEKGKYVEIVGVGEAENARRNGRTLDWNGNEVIAGNMNVGGGNITLNGRSISYQQLEYLTSLIPSNYNGIKIGNYLIDSAGQGIHIDGNSLTLGSVTITQEQLSRLLNLLN